MIYKNANISGWNNYPRQTCQLIRPEKYTDLAVNSTLIARGQGRSYGDAALNTTGCVVLTERLNRFLHFDRERGILTAEAGVTLADILSVITPAGWFLPVVPGTKFVSLGGCIAADVHGKNHHHKNAFSRHLLSIELLTANNDVITCSNTQNTDLFWATIGGMGLTGIIRAATIKLLPITSAFLQTQYLSAQSLEATIDYFDKNDTSEYSVAWINCEANAKCAGQNIIMTHRHLAKAELPAKLQLNPLSSAKNSALSIPFTLPSWLLNAATVSLFNKYYYKKHKAKTSDVIHHYETGFFPLDSIHHWNRLYGTQGFIQYQCLIPPAHATEGIKAILQELHSAKQKIFLGVLKRFGAASGGWLSFPMPGYTLALDMPLLDKKLFALLDILDDIVIHYGGRVYLAKDARLNAERFRLMYPHVEKWLALKKQIDPHSRFHSSLAQRLELC